MEYITQLHNRAEKMVHFIIWGRGQRHMSDYLHKINCVQQEQSIWQADQTQTLPRHCLISSCSKITFSVPFR